ncbi:MAG: VCBS repeat-containing protein [Gemmataceae bacterium]|nr:VCBS repeat-containing protein [Gemmataceae bacterium]
MAARPEQTAAPAGFPRFRMQEIETGLKVGYAVLPADINGDGKPDIVVVDTTRILWYENPTWKRRTIIEGQTRPDNVCIAAHDIDGDGKIDLALGAGWRFLDTKNEGTLQWLRRGKTLDERWTVHPIGTEVSIHRIRFADLDQDGTPELLVAPTLGRGSSKGKNWMDGDPVRLLAYRIPKDPVRGPWVPEVLDNSLHVVHNFWSGPGPRGNPNEILVASYEGVSLLQRKGGKWDRSRIGVGNQAMPDASRGASEIKFGSLDRGKHRFLAAVEPFHGHEVIVYTPPADPAQKLWNRHLVDDQLRWGHAVSCADLDGDGSEELIIGVRDDLSLKPGQRRGVRVYRTVDGKGARWERSIVEEGGMAAEDLAAVDLNGDGRVDLVAAGRQTHNLRIYWNEGVKR